MGKNRGAIFVILLTVFIDAIGIGLVYPLASPLILQVGEGAFLPAETATATRGIFLGLLMGSFTIGQFIGSPIVGGLSDLKGRRKVVLATLWIAVFSYLLGGFFIVYKNIYGLCFSRFLAGIVAGNSAVMQASMADLSTLQEKAKKFSWLGTSFGIGFIMGPYLGGRLSDSALGFTFITPFWAATALAVLNLFCALLFFHETAIKPGAAEISLLAGFKHLKKALHLKQLRGLFMAMFLYFLGWELFIVFGPVFLIERFSFTQLQISYFYAYVGLWCVIGNGLVMRFTSRFAPSTVLKLTFPLWGLSILVLSFVRDPDIFWWVVAPVPGIGAIIFSTGSALVSNSSDVKVQGETLGIYQSLQGVALALPPLCVGSLAALYPSFPLILSAISLFFGSLIWWLHNKTYRLEVSSVESQESPQ